MALVHELEKSGNWLFRRRSWLPVVFIAAGIAALYLTNRQAIIFNLTPELLFLESACLERLSGFTPWDMPRKTLPGETPWQDR